MYEIYLEEYRWYLRYWEKVGIVEDGMCEIKWGSIRFLERKRISFGLVKIYGSW